MMLLICYDNDDVHDMRYKMMRLICYGNDDVYDMMYDDDAYDV